MKMRILLQVLKETLLPRNYELLLNRAYTKNQATLAILPEVDTLLTSKGYVGKDALERRYGKWEGLASEMRASGHKEIDYVKSLRRKVEVRVSPKEDQKEMLQVCAKWGFIPVEKDLRLSLRKIAVGPYKEFDISSVNQRISEATTNSLISSTFGYFPEQD